MCASRACILSLNRYLYKIRYSTRPCHVTLGLDTSRLGFPPSRGKSRGLRPLTNSPLAPVHPRLCVYPRASRSSPRLISTGQLHVLPRFHLRPINHVVYMEPYLLKSERSHLRGSFTLRCFQRLSRPYVATQLCRWHDNWCTRGMSIPVLSY